METIDRKFIIKAYNPCTRNEYTEKNAILLCAKDKAVPAALQSYLYECIRLGCNPEHLESIRLLIQRVQKYQAETESRIPDTIGSCEVARCIDGKGV